MSDPHPHRRTIAQAIEDARRSPKWVPCDDISIDATFLIIRQVERRMDAAKVRPKGHPLYLLVEKMCFATGFDPGRRRLYMLVLMAYFRIKKARKQKALKLLKERNERYKAKQSQRPAA